MSDEMILSVRNLCQQVRGSWWVDLNFESQNN